MVAMMARKRQGGVMVEEEESRDISKNSRGAEIKVGYEVRVVQK